MKPDNFNRTYILNILRARGKTKISEIAKMVNVSRPTIYLHLENLEKRGLIRRTKDKTKKGAPVYIEPVEKNIAEKIKKEMIDLLSQLVHSGETEMKELKEIIMTQAYMEAGLRGFIAKKIYVTKEGVKFLRKNKK